jgi:hypothetical protein
MLRLPRPRDLDPELTRGRLPFYLRMRWLGAQVVVAVAAQFLWALATVLDSPGHYRPTLHHSVPVFVLASSLGYLFARLASRFLGVSWMRIRRGKQRPFDTPLGRATFWSGLAIVALPGVVNEFLLRELIIPVPFYSGAVVGMAFSFILWASGLPR